MSTLTTSEFVSKVVAKFTARQGVFTEHRNVEDFVPSNTTELKQALFLFYVIQLDYAIKGRVLYAGATALWETNPDFFDPSEIVEMEEEDLLEILTKYMKPRYPNEAVTRFQQNSKTLIEKYNGDPRQIFNDESGIIVAKRIREFRGMGPKTGHLLFRAMTLHFGYSFEDIEEVLPPVDRHDVRIAYFMGYTDSDEMTDRNIQKVKEIWSKACKESGANWLLFDQALWLMGSEGKPKSQGDVLKLLE